MTNKHFEKKIMKNHLEKTSCPQPCSQRLKQNACADERNHACQMTITMNIAMTAGTIMVVTTSVERQLSPMRAGLAARGWLSWVWLRWGGECITESDWNEK